MRLVGSKEEKPEVKKLTDDEKIQMRTAAYIEGLSEGYTRGLKLMSEYDLECKRAQLTAFNSKTPDAMEKNRGIIVGLETALSEFGLIYSE